MKPKTYLCGGINGLGDAAAKDWREVAQELLRTDTLDPMRRDYRGVEDQNLRKIVFLDLWDILRCRYILVNATRPSWGTAMEIVYARLFGKRIYAFVGDARISPWLKFHCTSVWQRMEDAISIINFKA
jgi:hypothetical protein